MSQTETIVVLEGDETGQELLEEALRVLAADVTGRELRFDRFDLSLASRRATRNEIVYVPNLDAHLERLADGSKRLRFRVRLDFEPKDPDSERRRFAGMRIEPVTPYTWFYKP